LHPQVIAFKKIIFSKLNLNKTIRNIVFGNEITSMAAHIQNN
jgi:hypothetical protein